MLKPFLIVSPEYGTKIDIGLDDGTGPLEYGADVTHVEAENRRDALLMGVMLFKKQRAKYLQHVDNPYADVEVISQVCSIHGMPQWDPREKAFVCVPCEGLLDISFKALMDYSPEPE